MGEIIENLEAISRYIEQQTCEDSISRQAVLDIVDSYSESQSNVEDVTQDIISDIMGLPPVTPQLKRGQWEWVQYDGNSNIGNWHCSECRSVVIECANKEEIPLYKYCSNCGAKMQEVEE